MKRSIRIAFEVFGPPAIATVLLAGMFGFSRGDFGILREIPALTAIAYLYAIVPSIVYAIAMEVTFFRFFSPGSWMAVAFSAVLGTLSGIGIVSVINPHHVSLAGFMTMAIIGLVVGSVLGVVILICSRKGHAILQSA